MCESTRVHFVQKGASALRKCRIWHTEQSRTEFLLPDQESKKNIPKKEAIKFILFCIQFFSFSQSLMTLRSDTIPFSLLYRSFSCTHTHTVCRVPFIAPCVCVCAQFQFFFLYLVLKKKRWNCEDTLDCIQQIQISSMWNIGESLLAVHKPTGFFLFLCVRF